VDLIDGLKSAKGSSDSSGNWELINIITPTLSKWCSNDWALIEYQRYDKQVCRMNLKVEFR
jgi:hypothetical protein